MTTDRPARQERTALADLMLALGPEAPTLCGGWNVRDLAAHLIVRERRLDAAAGILLPALRHHTEAVRSSVAQRPFLELVDEVRQPPWWSWSSVPGLDILANTAEFFVHHEDVRRAQPQWHPRDLSLDMERVLWSRAKYMARMALRNFRATIELHAPGHGEITVGSTDGAGSRVRLSGPPGELVLFLFGRQNEAHVTLTGPEAEVRRLRQARLGI